MITRDELVDIGRYNKPHGVNGEISATVDCDIDVLERFSCLVSDVDGIFVPFFIKQLRTKSAQSVLLTVDGINDDTEAALLVNKDIYVLKREYSRIAQESESDDYPIDYFIGFSVDEQDGTVLGEIVDVDDTTANVLFKVKTPGDKEVLVPAVDDFIVDIDIDKRQLTMNIPKELLQL